MDATLTQWQRFVRHSLTASAVFARASASLRVFCAAAVAVLLAGSALAQQGTGTIEGRVLNIGSGRYLSSARVTVEGTNLEAFTDDFGNYHIDGVPAGAARVKTVYTGLDENVTTVQVEGGKSVAHNVELTSADRYGADKVLQLDTFVVAAQREYEGDALATNEQRYAPNVKVVMASDSFGAVNEGNPGEFLKYLPGVTVDYVAADVRTVSVRGFSSQFTNVYWDGMRMTSSVSGNTQRVFEFEQVSINNTSRSEVAKMPTPEFPADSLGGTINFVSKNAFERKGAQLNYRVYLNGNNENLDFKKTAGPGVGKSYKILPNFDFDYTLPVNDRFGVVITGLSSNQYVEQHRWQPTWNYAQAGATPTTPYLQQYQIQDGPKTTHRHSLGAKADWKITDNQVLSFGVQNNYYHSFFGNRNLNFNVGTTATPATTGGGSLTWGPDFVTSATGRASVTQGSSFRDKYGNTFGAKLNWSYKSGDWTAEAGAAYFKSRTWYRALGRNHFSNVGTTLQNVSTVSAWNFQDPAPGIIWVARDAAGNSVDPYQLSNYRLGTLRDDPVDGFSTSKQVKADIERQFGLSFPLSLRIGFDSREETKDNRRYQNDYTYLGADGTANTADDNAGPYVDTTYLGTDPYWNSKPIQWINPNLLANTLISNPAYFRLGTGTAQTGVQAETFRRQNSEKISERVTSGYFQFEGRVLSNKLRFIAGARYEKTEDKGEGPLNLPDAIWQRNADGSYVDGSSTTAGVQRVRRTDIGTAGSLQELDVILIERGYKADRSYDGIYPSVHLTYNFTEQLLGRLSWAKTIGRPDYANIVPNSTINEDDSDPTRGDISIRNTALKPWTANNYDLSLEFYPKKGGLASIGVFQKNLSDFWTTTSGTLTSSLADTLGLDSSYANGNWTVSTTTNGGDAKITGEEFNVIQPLSFLPGWGRYFTIKANGTRLHLSGANSPDFRAFISKTGNFNISFNKAPFSANLTFNYRGRQMGTSTTSPAAQTGAQYGTTTGFVEYYAPRTFVDFSGEYKFSKRMAVFLGVRNMFNKPQIIQRYSYNSPVYSRTFRQEEFAISCSVGIKGTF